MKNLFFCLLILWTIPAAAQKGDWYTYSTGKASVCHIKIDDEELLVERMDPAFRQLKLAGAAGKTEVAEKIEVKRINANGRSYFIHLSFDNLYFCTTFKYFKKEDSLQMYCADGIDDGYQTMQDVMAAIKKDTGTHFSITLYRKEKLDEQKRKQPITKVTEEEFSAGLQGFTSRMDQFWQYRGYGRYEPFQTWMGLIYGNAFAEGFDDKFNKLSLTATNLKKPISAFGNNPAIKKQLKDAGLLEEDTK